jgi:hypothetical protein
LPTEIDKLILLTDEQDRLRVVDWEDHAANASATPAALWCRSRHRNRQRLAICGVALRKGIFCRRTNGNRRTTGGNRRNGLSAQRVGSTSQDSSGRNGQLRRAGNSAPVSQGCPSCGARQRGEPRGQVCVMRHRLGRVADRIWRRVARKRWLLNHESAHAEQECREEKQRT